MIDFFVVQMIKLSQFNPSNERKIILKKRNVVYLLFSVVALAACSADQANDESENNSSDSSVTQVDSEQESSDEPITSSNSNQSEDRTLVAYFSVPETDSTDAVAGASRVVNNGEVLGNTEQVAMWISDESGADIHQIETVKVYPNGDPLRDLSRTERAANERPELSSSIDNLDEYDTIFVGYPIWLSDMPMAMYTFFETTNFEGKTIIPFSTRDVASGFPITIETIQSMAPGAFVEEDNVLTIGRTSVSSSENEVRNWVSSLGY